jgi:hypothetical protein
MGISSARNLAALALFFMSSAMASQPHASMEERMDAVYAVERALPFESDPAPRLRQAFAENFGDVSVDDLASLTDRDLRFYLRASNTLAFFSYDPQYLGEVEAAFSLLEAHASVTQQDFSAMFSAYVEFREFEKAKALAARHPRMESEALPPFRDESGTENGARTVLSLVDDGAITRIPAPFAMSGPQVVVAAHPLCHFSENAIRAIDADPELSGLFAGRTLWLMPQDRHMNVDVVRDWNREFPQYRMQWAYRTADWPMIKRWATPNFYFFKDGKLVSTVVGWPDEGQRTQLLAAFRGIGVSPPEPAQASR